MTGQTVRLNLFQTTKELFSFSVPIVFGQLGMMLIAMGDVYVASKHGTVSAAALGVAVGFMNPIFLFGIGLLMGVAPTLSIKRGKGEDPSNYFFSNLVYSLIIGILMMVLMAGVYLIIPFIGIKTSLVPFVQKYILITTWSLPFAAIFQVIKEHLQAFEKVKLANVIAMVGVFVNLIFNFGFVFGKWGFPLVGYDGLAYASLGVRIFLAILIFIFSVSSLKSYKIHVEYIKEVSSFSLPIAGMIFLEVLGFCFVSIVIGTIGITESAANNIVLNLASLTFMIPLSISSAATVKVGFQYGQSSLTGVSRFTFSALLLSQIFMCFSCSMFMLFPEQLMGHMSVDPSVILIGVELLFIVGLFQIVDGIQVTLAGVLRGMKRTKESFYAIVVAYWFLGLPLGLYLTFYQGMKPAGLWIGLAISLLCVALALGVITKKQLQLMQN